MVATAQDPGVGLREEGAGSGSTALRTLWCRPGATIVARMTTPRRPIRIGFQIRPQHVEYPAIRRAVADTEDLGVDVVTTWDHFFPLHGEPEGKHFECWTMLAAFAEQTSRVEIGALVTCNSYRNPDLLAYMAGTVDHISDGRLILGIGSGWFEKDYDAFGYEFGTAGRRLRQLGGALPRIQERLDKLNPPPTRKIPILIGGSGERKTLRLVAEHADIWHSFGNPAVLRHKHAVLREHCDAVGRNIAEIEVSVGVTGGQRPQDAGSELLDAGATFFTVSGDGPDFDTTLLREWLAWRDVQNG